MEPWNDALSEDWVSQSRSSPPSLPSSVPLSFDQSDFGSDPPKSRIPQLKHLSRRLTSSTISGGPRASLAKGEAGGSERVLRRSAGNRASAHRSYDAKSQLGYSEGRGPGQEPQAASVSSNQTTQQHTVQHKSPRQSPGKDDRGIGTPEWRKRLLKGDTSYGDKTDLFSPSGLENIFRPPLRQTAKSKRAGLAKEKFTTFHDQPLPEETGDLDDPRLQDAHCILGTKDDEGLKENIPPPKNTFDQSLGEDGEFNPIATSTWREDPQGRATVLDAFGVDAGQTTTPRISSGSQSSSNRSTNQRQDPDRQGEDSNEDISPIFISRHNTVDGRIDYAALDLADGTPQPLSNWSSRRYEEENTSRSSPALPSWRDEDIESSRLLPPFNSSEFLDVTSRRGFISVKRGGFSSEGSFQRRNLSPSSLPASAKSDELDQSVEQRQEGMDGDVSRKPLGSPMRLFAPNYDSFTRDKLSRRLSHIEDTMYIEEKGENANDCDSLDQLVVNGSGEHQEEMAEFSLAGASQLSLPPLFAANPRTNDASQRTTSFGDGQLDKYTFHEDSSFGSLKEYSQESNSTPPAPKPLQREGSKFKFNLSSSPSEQASLPSRNILRTKIIASKTLYSDVAETVAPKKVNDATALPSEKGVTKYAFISGYTNSGSFVDRSDTRGKRAPMSPARGPVAKKRRTLNADDFEATKEALISSNLVAENHRQMQSITGKRKDARYEDDQTVAKPEIVARRQILKPRALSNKKSTSDGQTNRTSSSAEPHKMNEAHIALEARVAAAEDQLNAMGIGQKMTEDRRKGSVTTQDFLDEATRVMEFIRARNRPRSGLTSLEESEMESQRQGESSVHRPESEILLEEDESTREEFSRPPSREGGRALPVKQLKELDPRILSHLQKYKDSESSGIPSSSIETLGVGNNNDASVKLGLETATRAASPEFESQPPNIRITHHTASSNARKHLENASFHNRPNQDQALNSHGSGSSSQHSSIRSIPTGSSSRSNTKQNIAPGTITHLIPGQVAGMVYDGTLQRWVKAKSLSKKREALEARKGEDDSEEDPFGGIPDLSVNELEELERIKLAAQKRRAEEGAVSGLFGPISGIEGERAAPEAPPTDGNDPTISRPQTRDGTMPRPTESSSVPSKISRFASSGPVPETRATSWGDTIDGAPWKQSPIHPRATVMVQEDQGDVEVVEHEIQYNEGRQPSGHDLGSATLHQLRRSVTVAFSSPLVSRSLNFEPDGDQVRKQEIWAETSHDDLNDSIVDQYLDVEHSFVSDAGSDRRRSVSSTSISAYKGPPCRVSFGGQSFPARPVSRIEEQTEDSFMTVRRNERAKASFNVTVTTPLPVHSVDRSHTSDRKPHLTFHLSPLPDFTINQIDESFNLDVEHVAKHRGLLSMRDVETSYALQTERLVKHITDIQPYEPYWDYLQEVQLQRKGLITLCKLDQFCGRIERLDVSENELGQVHGVPNSIRDLKISRNCLSNLTAWAHLINLQYLDVSHNEIDDLSCFSMLIHLRELKADGNKVSSLQGAFGMNGLVSLKLRRNCLEVMDFAGANLTRLTDFNVQGNQLSSVRNLHHLPALTNIDLSDNQLESFSGDPKIPHPNLKTLRLTNNKLHSLDVHAFPNLRTTYVDNNFLTTVEGLRRTTHLDSFSVRQQSPPLDPDTSTSLDINIYYEVRKLYLSSNTIPTLDPTIPFLNLQYLELANSGLQSLPPSFGSLFPNVRVLNLNFNALRDIRPLARITRLKKLFLAGNRLTRLRKTTTILERFRWLTRVDLRNNPLTLGFYPPLTESRVIVHKESEPADQDLIVDPYVLQDADPEKDAAYKARLDLDTKMRRRVYEMLIASGCPGLRVLDGLRWERERAVERDEVWTKLVEMGVVKDTEGETPAEGEAVEEAAQKDSGKVSPEEC